VQNRKGVWPRGWSKKKGRKTKAKGAIQVKERNTPGRRDKKESAYTTVPKERGSKNVHTKKKGKAETKRKRGEQNHKGLAL